jgi:hypothetical protein
MLCYGPAERTLRGADDFWTAGNEAGQTENQGRARKGLPASVSELCALLKASSLIWDASLGAFIVTEATYDA